MIVHKVFIFEDAGEQREMRFFSTTEAKVWDRGRLAFFLVQRVCGVNGFSESMRQQILIAALTG